MDAVVKRTSLSLGESNLKSLSPNIAKKNNENNLAQVALGNWFHYSFNYIEAIY